MAEHISTKQDDVELYLLISKAAHSVNRVRARELSEKNITDRQAMILYTVGILGPRATLKEISRAVFRELNSTSEQVTRLENKGLVEKVPTDRDLNAAMTIKLTEKGEQVFDFIRKWDSIQTLMSVLSPDDREALRLCLGKVMARAQEDLPGNS